LRNGKVLVAGGSPGLFSPPISIAELYDPVAQTWTLTGAMSTNRSGHTATLLPNGKVLAAGGTRDGFVMFSSAELYDPATGQWTLTGSMATNRAGHSATLLPSGKVLVAGGVPGNTTPAHASAELYDPDTGTWTPTGSMTAGHQNHTATLLPGRVLVAGGYSLGYLSSTEWYDFATGEWTAAGALSTSRSDHTATLLPNGKVLVAGGWGGGIPSGPTNSAELYDADLGFNSTRRPQITTVTSPLTLGNSLTIAGSKFRGISDGSGGNTQTSPTDHPLLQLRSLENEQTLCLLTTGWSSNSLNSTPVTGLPPGWTLATVFVNGIASTGVVVNVSIPVPAPPILTAEMLSDGSLQFGFTNTVGAEFVALATTNIALPMTNWTLLGGVTEVLPGQFQFTSPQDTNAPQRFYGVRSQ